MDDLISRHAAINVIERNRAYIGHNMERAVGAAFIEILNCVGEEIGRLPSIQLGANTNVGTKLGTDLAQLGTDCISRQQAIESFNTDVDMLIVCGMENAKAVERYLNGVIEKIKQLPSAQPEIVRCKDCKHWIPYDWMFSEVWQSRNIADYPEDEIGCKWCDMSMKANDFCSRADRREVTT